MFKMASSVSLLVPRLGLVEDLGLAGNLSLSLSPHSFFICPA